MPTEPYQLWLLPSDFASGLVPEFHPPAGDYDVWARGGSGCLAVRVTDLQTVGPLGGDGWTKVTSLSVPKSGGPNSSRVGLTWTGTAPHAIVFGRDAEAPTTDLPGPDDARVVAGATLINPPRDDHTLRGELRWFRLADECVASCNPAIGDLDGDGLDEFAVPYSLPDGRDCVACFKGDGTRLWDNQDLAFFQRYYDDPDRYVGFHLHHRGGHRHLWSQVYDADGDGEPEVVVGIGPLYLLDAKTGAVKQVIDLDGGVHFWCFARFDGPSEPASLVCAVDPIDRDQPGRIVALQATEGLPERFRVDVPSRRFEDCIKPGLLTDDQREIVCFSLTEVKEFWAVDGDGQALWKVSVPAAIGDDSHVDDFRYIVHPTHGRCVVSGTGGTMLNARGEVVWTLQSELAHGQTVQFLPIWQPGGPAFYFADSFSGRSLWASMSGDVTARMADFTTVKDGHRGAMTHRLTTAGDLVHWGEGGSILMVQGEILYNPQRRDVLAGHVALRLSAIATDGRYLGRLPVFDRAVSGSWAGPMCVKACHVTPGSVKTGREDLLVVLHSSSAVAVYSPAGEVG